MAAVTLLGVAAPTVSAKTATPVQASTYPKTEMRSFVRNVFAQNNSRGSAVIIKMVVRSKLATAGLGTAKRSVTETNK